MTDTMRESLDVSRETARRLDAFVADLLEWNTRLNLIAPSTEAEVWARHVLDSAQLTSCAPAGWMHWLDIGSGAGFPGLVIALLARDYDRAPRVTLIESDQRKAAFLIICAQRYAPNARVLPQRAEYTRQISADVISARAVADLNRLLDMSYHHGTDATTFLFPKGAQADEEIAAARRAWRFDLETLPSSSDPSGRILKLTNLTHAD
jgi:16S rRNA (guanine527-N7)-methyltransferase